MRSVVCFMVLLVVLMVPSVVVPSRSVAQGGGYDGRPDHMTLVVEGQSDSMLGVGYRSAVVAAPRAFTHMFVRRTALVPQGAVLVLAVRVSEDGVGWSDWGEVVEDDDLWNAVDGPEVAWSQVIAVGGRARFWQVSGRFDAAPDGALPVLRRVDVSTVDAAFGGMSVAGGVSPDGVPGKPNVVSRTAWGCPDGQGSRVTPTYYPVNHMVVHHTADSNTLYPSEPDWAARVRAEWSFHTYTRGWGDVGYNFLVDPNGVVYEGRAGGDDAVAFHDTANYGSMGVVLIGTYASVAPTGAAQESLVRLLAWKAGQKHIDPLARSYYYGCAISRYCAPFVAGAIVPNIAGHREVTPGHTTCPGDSLLALLPDVRLRVKQVLDGGGGDNGDLVIDDLEGGFARSPVAWHEAGCGYGGHTYWTYATDGVAENSATWRPTIPATGSYRVYVHVPQGCGLASAPYATVQAVYKIGHVGGVTTRQVDQNTAIEWVDLGVYTFQQGTGGAVELYDDTGEPLSAARVIFFDAVKWVPESASASVELLGVAFDRTTVADGGVVKVTFTVRNSGTTMLYTQDPQSGTAPDGSYNDGVGGRLDDAYVYDEGECFLGDSVGSYPAYPKESDRFRLVLGPTDMSGVSCVGDSGGYPWRWGLNGSLPPGVTREVVGYVRFRNVGLTNRALVVRAGVIQEYVQYFAQGVNPTTITIVPEGNAPDVARYDAQLAPLASVYRMGSVPNNFLARTRNPHSIPRGDYVGSFAWDGGAIDWGNGGPLGVVDQFLVEQTRVLMAPVGGVYTFRVSSDDGAWLWVDGQALVVNYGLHAVSELTGTISLSPGAHVVSFKYFEQGGSAVAGYAVAFPGDAGVHSVPDGLGAGALRLGSTFVVAPDLTLVADDTGGRGVDHVHWSSDGVVWQDSAGALLHLGVLANGVYHIAYQAVDVVGNTGVVRQVDFSVNTNLPVYRVYVPLVLR